MGEIWFSADWHLGNDNIIRYTDRPFDDHAHMDEAIISHMNSVVGPNDDLYVVGDACMGQIAYSLPLISKLHSRVHLIPGNHDRVHPCYDPKRPHKMAEWEAKYLEHFYSIVDIHAHIGGFNVSHFPYDGDRTEEDRYPEWRMEDDGTPLICGHVHEAWKTRESERGTPMVNVGVDVWAFGPVNYEILRARFF